MEEHEIVVNIAAAIFCTYIMIKIAGFTSLEMVVIIAYGILLSIGISSTAIVVGILTGRAKRVGEVEQ